MRKLLILFFVVVLGILCKKEEQKIVPPPPPEDTTAIPIVQTMTPSEISSNGLVAGGQIKSKGGLPILAKGICWSLSANPTLADSVAYSLETSDTFTCHITGMAPLTEYHIRAFAKNDLGVGYGGDSTITTLDISRQFTVHAVGWRNMDVTCNGMDPTTPACLEHLPFTIDLTVDTLQLYHYNGIGSVVFGTGIHDVLHGVVNFHMLGFDMKLDQEEPTVNGSQHGTVVAEYKGNHIYEGTYNRWIIVPNPPFADTIILSESGHLSVEWQP